MSVYTDFLADPLRENNFCAVMTPGIIESSVDAWEEVTLRVASRKFDTGPSDTPPNTRFWSRLVGPPYRYKVTRAPTHTTSFIQPESEGVITLGQFFGDLDSGEAQMLAVIAGVDSIRDLSFGGRSVSIYHGGYSDLLGREMKFAEYGLVHTGKMGAAVVNTDVVEIPLKTQMSIFETPFQHRVFQGRGSCLYSDGSSAYVTIGTQATFDDDDFTWEFSIWIEALPAAKRAIICRGVTDVDGYIIYLNTDGTITLQLNESGAHTELVSSALVTGRWYRVSVRYNGDTEARFYIDGEGDESSSTMSVHTANAARTLYFLREDASGADNPNIHIDDVRFWNEQRFQEDIAPYWQREIEDGEIVELAAFLKGYWRMNDSSPSVTVTDSTATAAHGDMTGHACLWVPSLTGLASTGLVASVAGQPLPDVWGYNEGFEPVLIDEARGIYQVHGAKIEAFYDANASPTTSAVAQGGNRLALTTSGAFTSKAAFDAATPGPGQFINLITNGGAWIRLGSQQNKPITVACKGDKSDGTYRTQLGDVVRYIIKTRGQNPLTDSDLVTTDFDTLNSLVNNPGVIRYNTKTVVSLLDVVNFLINSVGAVMWRRRSDGKIRVKQFNGAAGAGTPTITIDERDISYDTDNPAIPVDPPVGDWRINYSYNARVHTLEEMVDGVAKTAMGAFLRKMWRHVNRPDDRIKNNIPDAVSVTVDTCFTTVGAANVEKNRRGPLFGGIAKAFKFRCRDRLRQIDYMDPVYFHYQDQAFDGSRQSRFGGSATDKYVVVGIEELDNNEIELTIWQEGTI